MTNTSSSAHPHEPAVAPILDGEGRCLVCVIDEQRDELTRLRETRRLAVAVRLLEIKLNNADSAAECEAIGDALNTAREYLAIHLDETPTERAEIEKEKA